MILSYHAGWMYLVDLSGRKGCESQGDMPCLIISTEEHNALNGSVIVVPCTVQLRHCDWAQHVAIYNEQPGQPVQAMLAMTEHVTEIDKSRLGKCIGRINSVDYDAVVDNLLTHTIRKEI